MKKKIHWNWKVTYFGLPKCGGSVGKESICNAEDLGLILSLEDPLEEAREPTSIFLPGETHGQRSLVSYSSWGHKELDTTEQVSTAHILSCMANEFKGLKKKLYRLFQNKNSTF